MHMILNFGSAIVSLLALVVIESKVSSLTRSPATLAKPTIGHLHFSKFTFKKTCK